MPLSTLTNSRGRNMFPMTLGPLAWWYAHPKYLTLGAASIVNEWRDRSGNGNTLTPPGAANPVWSPNGWRTGVGAVDFNGTDQLVELVSGSALSHVTGTDIPFSCLLTARIDVSNDHGILMWSDAGTARSEWRTNNAPPETLRYRRVDDAASSVVVTGSLDVGTANSRFGLSFPGTTVTTYRARDVDNNATACNVGACTFTTFTFGQSTVGQLDGVAAELIILPRAMTAAEWQAYVYYSIGEFG